MQVSQEEAQESLRAIADARSVAALNSENNGVMQIVYGVVVLICLISFDILGPIPAAILTAVIAFSTSGWCMIYARRLPIKPMKMLHPGFFGYWGIYHVAVLMGGMSIATHFWHMKCAPFPTFTLIGIVDSAPLFYVGFRLRFKAKNQAAL